MSQHSYLCTCVHTYLCLHSIYIIVFIFMSLSLCSYLWQCVHIYVTVFIFMSLSSYLCHYVHICVSVCVHCVTVFIFLSLCSYLCNCVHIYATMVIFMSLCSYLCHYGHIYVIVFIFLINPLPKEGNIGRKNLKQEEKITKISNNKIFNWDNKNLY